jgi:CRP/FNR family cyclic AMP-dependent transcriptional regulator
MSGRDRQAAARFALTPEELRAMTAHAVARSFPKNAVIVNEGDRTDSLYVILEGRVKAYVADAEGKEAVLSTQGPGEYFGEMVLDEGPRSASIITLEPSRFLIVPKSDFKEFLARNPAFAARVIEKLIHRVRALTENVKSLALMDAYGRIAHLLLDLAEKREGRLVITERLTQKDIASRVGASREMVSLILKDLTAGGYIRTEGQSMIIERTPPPRW